MTKLDFIGCKMIPFVNIYSTSIFVNSICLIALALYRENWIKTWQFDNYLMPIPLIPIRINHPMVKELSKLVRISNCVKILSMHVCVNLCVNTEKYLQSLDIWVVVPYILLLRYIRGVVVEHSSDTFCYCCTFSSSEEEP